jgi:hypothetical protein
MLIVQYGTFQFAQILFQRYNFSLFKKIKHTKFIKKKHTNKPDLQGISLNITTSLA